jgi:hypothetical protein
MLEQHRVLRQRVDVRRGGSGVAITTQVIGAQRIDADQQEIALSEVEGATGLLVGRTEAGRVRAALLGRQRIAFDRIFGGAPTRGWPARREADAESRPSARASASAASGTVSNTQAASPK